MAEPEQEQVGSSVQSGNDDAVRAIVERQLAAHPDTLLMTQEQREMVAAALEGAMIGVVEMMARVGVLIQASADGTVRVDDLCRAIKGGNGD